jgi:hypothetical protein
MEEDTLMAKIGERERERETERRQVAGSLGNDGGWQWLLTA